MKSIIIKNEEIDALNEYYGTEADANDAYHYKLCQVILHLEDKLLESGEDPRKNPPPTPSKGG